MMFKLGDATVVCTIYKNKICATIVCEECTNIENVRVWETVSIKMKPVEGRIFRELNVWEKKVFAKFKFVMRVLKTFNNMHMARWMNYISKGFFDCLEILTGITVEQIKGSLQYGEESIE